MTESDIEVVDNSRKRQTIEQEVTTELDGASGPHKDGLKRTPRACDRCRFKKSKCNGQQPCTTCTRSERTCVYSARTRRDVRKWHCASQELTDEAIQRLYKATKTADNFPGILPHGRDGIVTTEDILVGLGLASIPFPQTSLNSHPGMTSVRSKSENDGNIANRQQEDAVSSRNSISGRYDNASETRGSSNKSTGSMIVDTGSRGSRGQVISRKPKDGKLDMAAQFAIATETSEPQWIQDLTSMMDFTPVASPVMVPEHASAQTPGPGPGASHNTGLLGDPYIWTTPMSMYDQTLFPPNADHFDETYL